MFNWLWHLFDTSGFPPRWTCGSGWAEEPLLGWLHIVSDVATFAAYYAVPCIVAWYVLGRPEISARFPKSFWVFLALVFFSCGTVHLLEAGIFWWPHYRLSALSKVLTAGVSLVGVVVLAKSLPRALELKTPEQLQAEVEERRQAESRLEFERNLLHTLMNNLPDSIYFKDLSGKYLRVSQSLADNLKLNDASEAIGKSESDFLPRGKLYEADDELVLRSGTPIIGRVERALWSDYNDAWVSTSRLPLVGNQHQKLGTFGISHDITSVKRTEERLSTLAHKLALPRDADEAGRAPLLLSQFCLRDMISCGSDIRAMGLRDQSRMALEQQLVEYLYRRIQAEQAQPAFALVRMFQTTALKNLDGELQRLAHDSAPGHELQPETRCLVLGGTVGLDPSWNDPLRSLGHRVIPLPSISAVEKLPMILQLIRQLGIDVGGIVEGHGKLLMQDVHANVFHVPKAIDSEYIPAQDDFVIPYKIESVVGFGDLLPSGDLFAVICFSRIPIPRETAVLFSHLSISAKLALLATEPPGERVEAQIHAVDALVQNYEQVVCDQETLLQDAMGELETARDAADAANRAKSDFLANMSHEIRTPMNAIIGLTEMVLDGDVSRAEREYLTTVLDSGESLLNIINEILDFSKIEAGKLELEESEFDIREQIGDMVRSLGLRAHRKGIELAYEIDSSVPPFVVADVDRLRQVIINLTGNAIKFTERGEVVVRVDAPSMTDDEATLRFCVVDTGIGIPPEKRETVFDAFAQADTSTTRNHGGTGLGLAISANIIDAMGGKIDVESEVGVGSQFSFTISVGLGDRRSSPIRRSPEDLRGVSALLVDDNATNLHILEKMLQAWEMHPICAINASEAIDVLEDFARQSKSLPIVVTDVHMPGTDGYELIERIQQTTAIADAAIIVLTSGQHAGDQEKYARSNVIRRILKPVKQAEILSALLAAHGSKAFVVDSNQPLDAAASRRRPLDVLLVEDGIANQKLAIGLLERWGHTVEIAENGAEAVEMYRSGKFDLILMDLQMPVMDGLEATKQIRNLEAISGQHVPIIAMTAHALVGDRERCIAAGMDDYISKPIRKNDLDEAINMFFDPDHIRDASTEAGDESHTADATGDRSIDHEIPSRAINLSAALDMMGGDRGVLLSVVDAFLYETPRLLQQLTDAIENGDQSTAHRAAHTIKGGFRSLQLHEQQESWGRVETIAREGRLAEIGESLDEARAIAQQALEQLTQFRDAERD